MEYQVQTKWTGWLGGWGSERNIAALLNGPAAEGWRLARIDSKRALWWYAVPRIKLICIFERERSI